jgi:hypothetical protein
MPRAKLFTVGLLKGQEWFQFQKMMNNLMRNEEWEAGFDGHPWRDNSRIPEKGTRIVVQIKKEESSDHIRQCTQIYVSILGQSTKNWYLEQGQESVQFEEKMRRTIRETDWAAWLGNKRWEDDSWIPNSGSTVCIDRSTDRCAKQDKIPVIVHVGNKSGETIFIRKSNLWADFRKKVD